MHAQKQKAIAYALAYLAITLAAGYSMWAGFLAFLEQVAP